MSGIACPHTGHVMAKQPCDEEAVFHAARLLRSEQERDEYLHGACGDDAALLARVQALLSVHDESNSLGDVRLGPTADAVEVMPRPGSAIGRYRLLEQIGEGGFGTVFMAEQQHPVRRRVALKVIKPGMDTRQVIARFEAERQALALMDHPNIARVLDAGATETGRPYFVMELVRGVPITDYCDDNHLTPRQRLGLFVQVCQAVQHAHQKGVIHRDLKPSNVLVTMHDGVPVPKVIDFGVAKATGQQLTERTLFTNFAQLVGTPLYMSPEQAELSGLDVDTRADIYSLGVLLYELLTGTTPFDPERLKKAAFDEVRRIIREEEPPKPSTRLSTMGEAATAVSARRKTDPRRLGQLVRGELDWIVMKALEKDRNRRYETANGLAMDVKRYLADEPVAACPPGATYRLRKFARKHRLQVLAGGAVVAALVAGTVGTTAGLLRARSAQARAQLQAERAAALNDFMRRVLSSARPGHDGRDVRVADLLDTASADLDGRFRGQPDLELEARQALREAYDSLGLVEQSRHNLRRAHEASRVAHGEDAEPTLRLAVQLANVLAPGNDTAEAETLARAAYERAARVLGRGHRLTMLAGSSWSYALREQGRSDESERLLRELIRHTPTPPDEQAHHRLSDLALILGERGERPEAIRLTYQALEVARVTGQPQVSYRLYVTLRLGRLLVAEGRHEEAETVYAAVTSDPAVIAAQFTPGPRPREGGTVEKEYSRCHRAYVVLLRSRGKADEAERVRSEHMARLRAAVPQRAQSAWELTRRARLLARVGRFEDAAADYARAIELDPGDHWRWYLLGCLLAYTDQPQAYRAHCLAMVRQFGGAGDRLVAERAAKMCLMLPDAVPATAVPADAARLRRLVEVVTAPGANESHRRWFALLEGMAEYREGRVAAAVDPLEQCRRLSTTGYEATRATTLLFLAMAHHRLGSAETARRMFDEARSLMDQELLRAGEDDLEGGVLEEWLICHVVRREADALFADG